MTMTLREWLDSKPRGTLTEMSRATGYLAASLTRIANGVVKPKLFTAVVIETYTDGAVHFDRSRVICNSYRATLNGKYWNVCFGRKYLASRKTKEAALALVDEYKRGITA